MYNEFPNVIELEKRLLSALLLEEIGIFPLVTEILTAEDFYRPQHAMIFKALVTVYERGVPPDVSLVAEELKKRDELKKVELVYLHSLERLEFTTARAESYAKAIKEKSRLRAIIRLSEEVKDMACNGVKESTEILLELEQRRSQLTDSVESDATFVEILTAACEQITAQRESSGALLGVTTGLRDLDKLTGGLCNTDLIILAARPSMGKTALALNIAQAAARQVPVLFFSLEMSALQLAYRLISGQSRVRATYLKDGRLTDEEYRRALSAAASLESRRLEIKAKSGLTLSEIRIQTKQVKHKVGLGLVIIDYLQLIQGSKEYRGNRVQEISEISRGLKSLAKELDVPVLALSQLNRGVELRAEKRPQLSDLRESGSIEQDADIVMFLYREEYYDRDSPEQNLAEVTIAKNRNGATGAAKIYFERNFQLFGDLTQTGSV